MQIKHDKSFKKNEISDKIQNSFQGNSKIAISHIYPESGGYISANNCVFNNIPNTSLSKEILKESLKGTPLIKLGNGTPNLMIISGIHGNELPSQIASLILINELKYKQLNGTVYIIPFSAPKATMNNSRWFNSADINRIANIKGSLSNSILEKAKELNMTAIADFHSTAPNSNPGKEGIFCTMKPSPESFHIANFIAECTKSEVLPYNDAGNAYHGAIEDEANITGIPAVTCEVLSPNGYSNEKAFNKSLLQMKCFLNYFGIFNK